MELYHIEQVAWKVALVGRESFFGIENRGEKLKNTLYIS